eukprot:8408418-Pyramimonas_sp.AAC.1
MRKGSHPEPAHGEAAVLNVGEVERHDTDYVRQEPGAKVLLPDGLLVVHHQLRLINKGAGQPTVHGQSSGQPTVHGQSSGQRTVHRQSSGQRT